MNATAISPFDAPTFVVRTHARNEAVVLLPTYNERENVVPVLDRLLALPGFDVLVIDDDSPDGTGAIADARAAVEPRVQVLHRPAKSGAASAHLDGFRVALGAGYEYVVEMDADLSHAPEDVPRLLEACRTADVVIGSRFVPGARTVGRSWRRDALTWGAGVYARIGLGLSLHDCTGGFRCVRRSALQAVELSAISARGYAFQLELNVAWMRAGLVVRELPIVFQDRTAGTSKMSRRMVLEALMIVPRLRIRSRRATTRSARPSPARSRWNRATVR